MMDGSEDLAAADARLRTADGRKDMWRAVFSCWLCTMMVYAPFALLRIEGSIFLSIFFSDELLNSIELLHSIKIVSIIALPVGILLFAWLGDRQGRKQVMVFTVTLMAISTTMIGLIPRNAPVCLVLLNFAQNLGADAELACGTVMLGEYAATGRRGLVSSVIACGSKYGHLQSYAALLAAEKMVKSNYTFYYNVHEDWGWRIPFLGSSSIALAALWIRGNLRETPVFGRHRALLRANRGDGAPTGYWLRSKSFWTMVGLCMGDNWSTNLDLMYLIEFALDRKQTETELIKAVIGCLAVPLAAWLSDRYGRRPVYRTINLLLIVYPWPVFALMDSSENSFNYAAMVGLTLGYASIGARAAWGVELFGVRHRFTNIAVAEQLGRIVSLCVADLAVSAVYPLTGYRWWSIALHMSVSSTVGLLATFVAPETRGRDLNILDDAI